MGNIFSVGTTPPANRQPVMSQSDMSRSIAEMDSKFGVLDAVIGDVMGYGASADNSGASTLAGAIGDVSKVSIDLPMGQNFYDYKETFTTLGVNDFTLAMHPLDEIHIDDGTRTTYVRVDKGRASNPNEYVLIGRRLTFHTKPSSSFSVIYNGRYPAIEGYRGVGYAPNIMPSPDLIESGKASRPLIAPDGQGTYTVTISPPSENRYGEQLNGLKFNLADKLRGYISPTGAIECPPDAASIWKKFGNKYQKIHDAKVFILGENKFRFKTSLPINIASDIIVVSVSNWTIADTLDALARHMLTHRHSSEEIGAQIAHHDLYGNRAERYNNTDVAYGESIIRGDDHPHYFNREGYIANNPGNFNNAIIGDVLIGSSSAADLYNNVAADSRKIFFGSTSEGSSLMLSSAFRGLKLFGARNGLKIDTHAEPGNTDTAYGIALNADGHKIYGDGGVDRVENGTIKHKPNTLVLDAEDGLIELRHNKALASLNAGKVNSTGGKLTGELSVADGGSISVGDVSISKDGVGNAVVGSQRDDAVFKIDTKASIKDVDIKKLGVDVLSLQNGAKIKFGDDSGAEIKENHNSIEISSSTPVQISKTGRNTGIETRKDGQNAYSNTYVAAESGGVATESDHDTYTETGDGGYVFIRSTHKEQQEDGKEYVFGKTPQNNQTRIDNLKAWPRADIGARKVDAREVTVKQSSLRDRRGINFQDSAAIYATGNDTDCPPGWLVVESKNGTVFIDSRADAIDCQNMVYGEITSGSQKVFGSITVDKSIGVSQDITAAGAISGSSLSIANAATVGSINVKEDAKFTGKTQFTEDVSISSALSVGGSANVLNRLSANEMEITSRTILNGVTDINNTANIKGDVNIAGGINSTGDIRTSGKISTVDMQTENATLYKLKVTEGIEAHGDVQISGELKSTSNISTDGDLVASGGRFTEQVRTKNLIVEQDTKANGELYVVGRMQAEGDVLIGDVNKKFTVNSQAVFNNDKTSMIGILEVVRETLLKGSVEMVSDLTVGSHTTMRGGLDITGPLTSKSTGEFTAIRTTDQIRVGGDSVLAGRLSVADDVSLSKGLSVRGDIAIGSGNTIASFDSRAVFNKDVLLSGSVDISGDTNISGNTKVTGELAINSKAVIDGELKANGNAGVEGILTANGIVAKGQATFESGITSRRAINAESIYCEDISHFKGGISVDEESRFNGGITTSQRSTSAFGTVNILGGITQSDSASPNNFAGKSVFINGVDIAGESTIKGRVLLGKDGSGAVLEYNTLRLSGGTSLISATNAEINKIRGSTRVVLKSSGNNSQISSKINEVTVKEYIEIENAYVADTQVNRGDIVCMGTLYVGGIVTVETPGSSNAALTESTTPMNIVAARARYAP